MQGNCSCAPGTSATPRELRYARELQLRCGKGFVGLWTETALFDDSAYDSAATRRIREE